VGKAVPVDWGGFRVASVDAQNSYRIIPAGHGQAFRSGLALLRPSRHERFYFGDDANAEGTEKANLHQTLRFASANAKAPP